MQEAKERDKVTNAMNPDLSILPILEVDLNDRVVSVRGTGFVVGEPPYVVTARHVFEEEVRTAGNKFAV